MKNFPYMQSGRSKVQLWMQSPHVNRQDISGGFSEKLHLIGLHRVQSGLLPDAAVGGGVGPGCFTHLKGIATTRGQLWWWETIMTFLLVSVRRTLCYPAYVPTAAGACSGWLLQSVLAVGPVALCCLSPWDAASRSLMR